MSKNYNFRPLIGFAFIFLLSVIAFDSSFHFNSQKVKNKIKHNSAQHNWSLFYGQEHVFNNSSIRYLRDFVKVEKLIKPNSIVLSDLASSYYAAVYLPIYVVNTHSHHGQSTSSIWKQFISARTFCYIEFEEKRDEVKKFLNQNKKFDYVIVNKDRINSNRKQDCLAFRSRAIIEELPRFASLIFEGEFLNLYSLKRKDVLQK